jgi:hypothetical protein
VAPPQTPSGQRSTAITRRKTRSNFFGHHLVINKKSRIRPFFFLSRGGGGATQTARGTATRYQ